MHKSCENLPSFSPISAPTSHSLQNSFISLPHLFIRRLLITHRISFWNFGLWNTFSTTTTTATATATGNDATTTTSKPPRLMKIDFSSPSCLDLLTVRPVSVLVRRLPACTMSYQTVGDIQEKYRSRYVY